MGALDRIIDVSERTLEVDAALQYISPDEYDEWTTIGMAIQATLGDGGFELWDRWSSGSAKYPGIDALREKWLTFKPKGGIGPGTLFKAAQERGWKQPARKRIDHGANPDGANVANSIGAKPTGAAEDLAGFNERHSDVGNAKWFVRLYGGQLRWIRERGKWFMYAGTYWKEDVDGSVELMAKAAVDGMLATFGDVPRADRAALFKHVLKSEQAPRINAMLGLARSEKGITIQEAALDADPMVLGTAGGAINLRSGNFFTPEATDYITRRAGAAYDPSARCPTWCSFLDRIMDGDIAMIAFLQRAVGYSLTGDTGEQCLFLCHGTGSNGKSVFLTTLRKLVAGYGSDAAMATFVDRRNDAASNDLARLAGARYVYAAETGAGRRLSEELVKVATGGENITARFLFHEHIEFRPSFKLWLGVNHRPAIRGTDHGIWRRIRLVPFNVTIPDAEQDHEMAEKLQQELPGILNWALAGCAAWQIEGLSPPDTVVVATAAYRQEEDRVGQWIDERCLALPDKTEQASRLYGDFKTWSDARGEQPLTQTNWGRQLSERGYEKQKHGTVRYRGLVLRSGLDGLEAENVLSPYPPPRRDLP